MGFGQRGDLLISGALEPGSQLVSASQRIASIAPNVHEVRLRHRHPFKRLDHGLADIDPTRPCVDGD